MNTTKRIEYIDALRGFTMMLVVAVHVYALCFMQGNYRDYDLSFHNFFGLFRMPLFFFISGFVFYKPDRKWDFSTLKKFALSKVRVQLISTLIFFLLFCWLFQKGIIYSINGTLKAGYWFTYMLFVYFVLYIGIDKTISALFKKPSYSNLTIIVSFVVGISIYYIANNDYLLLSLIPLKIVKLFSIIKLQYFVFFSFGCFIHKYYDTFLSFQNQMFANSGVILIFVCSTTCIFYQNRNQIIIPNYLLAFISALFGIMLILFLFKRNEDYLSCSSRTGYYLQYIGRHTLDIYFLHYFFLPYNMSFLGKWLEVYPNPLLEFCISIILSLIVILFCLVLSRIIRLSPTLTYYLLGGKKKIRDFSHLPFA